MELWWWFVVRFVVVVLQLCILSVIWQVMVMVVEDVGCGNIRSQPLLVWLCGMTAKL
jgi:hypothetical protein